MIVAQVDRFLNWLFGTLDIRYPVAIAQGLLGLVLIVEPAEGVIAYVARSGVPLWLLTAHCLASSCLLLMGNGKLAFGVGTLPMLGYLASSLSYALAGGFIRPVVVVGLLLYLLWRVQWGDNYGL